MKRFSALLVGLLPSLLLAQVVNNGNVSGQGTGGAGGGTVTSFGLVATPSWLSVTGSPVTTSGDVTLDVSTGQTANQFLATPNATTGVVGLRSMVAADVPLLTAAQMPAFTGAITKNTASTVTTLSAGIVGTTNIAAAAVDLTTKVTGALPVANGGSGTASTLTGILRGGSPFAGSELSGDVTTSGSNAVTVLKLNGTSLAGLGTGLLKNTTGTGVPTIATAGTDFAAPGNYVTSLTGDVTAAGPGASASTVAVGAVTDAKGSLANKPLVRVAAVANSALTGLLTIDGITLVDGDVAMLSAQTTGAQNGPWVAHSGAWTRPTWYTSGSTTQSFPNATITVYAGSVNAGTRWRETAASPITIDTTTTAWSLISSPLNSLPTIAGSTSLCNPTSNTATPQACTLPVLNLQLLGACGITDGTTIFNAAETVAESTKQALYIPGGCTLNHTGALAMNGTVLVGDGPGSVLQATDQTATPTHALYIRGDNVVVNGINFKNTWTGSRSTQVYSCALCVRYGVGDTLTHFRISNNYWTSAFAGPDIELDYAGSHGDIFGNRMPVQSLSNPTIYQGPVDHVNIYGNIMDGANNGAGDTCIEMVTYSNSLVPGITYFNVENNILENCGALGVSVIGGAHINVEGNQILNVAFRSFSIFPGTGTPNSAVNYDINFAGNNINNTLATDYAIYIYGSIASPTSDVTVADNTIAYEGAMASSAAMQLGSCDSCSSASGNVSLRGVSVTGNTFTGDTAGHMSAAITFRGITTALIENNHISNTNTQALGSCCGNGGAATITGNTFYNIGIAATATYPVINWQNNAAGFNDLIITGNSYLAGTNAVTNFMTCGTGSPPTSMVYRDNVGSTTSVSTNCPYVTQDRAVITGGGTFTLGTGTGACGATSTLVGGPAGGSFLCTNSAGVSSQAIVLPKTPKLWTCSGYDDTSHVAWVPGGATGTGVTLYGTAASAGDKIVFNCTGQ